MIRQKNGPLHIPCCELLSTPVKHKIFHVENTHQTTWIHCKCLNAFIDHVLLKLVKHSKYLLFGGRSGPRAARVIARVLARVV
jgi:hypothetical protein